ncbi:MAG: hypothetical protein PHQ04_04605 [Opitutaceae bacterium]|nr:hypothetical protein [Opitutaceae bacterium]
MNRLVRLILASVLLALLGLTSGCSSGTSKESSIPWSRPATWEGQIPGMGSPSGL